MYLAPMVVLLSCTLVHCSSSSGSQQEVCPFEQLHMLWREADQSARRLMKQIVMQLLSVPTSSSETCQNEIAPSCSWIHSHNAELPSGYYWVNSSNGTEVQVYCDMTKECANSTGGWTRIAYLNMSEPNQQCPPAWREIETPFRMCGRHNQTACYSATFPSYGIEHSRVLGRAVGYQFGPTGSFWPSYRWTVTLDSVYVEGLSITHGNPRQHIWTFATAMAEISSHWAYPYNICPCTNVHAFRSVVPPFVGNDYFCETGTPNWEGGDFDPGVLYPNDTLWDGEDCGSYSTCCQFNNPPWFCKQLSEATSDDIEARICVDEWLEKNDVRITLLEIYVQ